ncbi:MAG: secretin N-terminal domain-containing protein [Thermodesulfobacteriota bacterium]
MSAVGLLSTAPGWCGAEVVVIPIQHRNAAELVPIIEHLLSSEGRVSHDRRTNSLIIIDRAEHLRNIRVVLDRTDAPSRQVNVRVRFHQTESKNERGGSVEGRVSGNDWTIGTGKPRGDGLGLRVRDDRSSESVRSEYAVRTTSGSSAYILAGQEVPFRSQWRSLCRGYAACPNGVEFRRIETGFEVTPRVRGDRVEIDLVPRISGIGSSGESEVIRFTEAATRLTAPLGEWVTVGGWDTQGDAVYRAILESASRRREETLEISLRVEPAE